MHLPQRAFGVKMTSYQRRCDVITSHRRQYDVIFAPNARWDLSFTTMMIENIKCHVLVNHTLNVLNGEDSRMNLNSGNANKRAFKTLGQCNRKFVCVL